MIRIEDEAWEDGYKNGSAVTVLPFSFHIGPSGEPEVLVYRDVLAIAEEFMRRFSCAPLSKEAISWIDDALRPKMREMGYEPDRRVRDYICDYRIDRPEELNRDWLRDDSVRIRSVGDYKNLTTFAFEEDPYGDELCFGTVIDGKLVSVAGMNPTVPPTGEREVNVQTAPDYRGNGYAHANIAALTDALLARGERVAYHCRHRNLASRKIAEQCGFKKIGESYYYICYKR